jgi:hypothetical protein
LQHIHKITHLLQVHDGDLDINYSYVVEAYYVHYQDANPLNNAAWKPVRVTAGSPGGEWTFDMTPEAVKPNIGFAIDSWPGASTLFVSEDNPPQKGHSTDGRLKVAYKVRNLGNGTWRYEYAVYNIDMDRGLKSLRIPVPASVQISNPTFHASEHQTAELDIEEGVQMDNAAWKFQRLPDAIVWNTVSNPLRWGTLYNFGFTANSDSSSVTAIFGLFKAGTPADLTGILQGPSSQ